MGKKPKLSNAPEEPPKVHAVPRNEVAQEEKSETDLKVLASEAPKLDFCQILTKPSVEQEPVKTGFAGPKSEPTAKKRGRKPKQAKENEKMEKLSTVKSGTNAEKVAAKSVSKNEITDAVAESKSEDATCHLAESEVLEPKMQTDEAESSSNEFEQTSKSAKRLFAEVVAPSRRSSVRIKNNQEEMVKKQEMQKLIEKELDEEEERANKKRKLTSKSGKQQVEEIVEVAQGDDDDIQIEKVVITPQKKAAKKLASIFIMGKKANPIKVVEDPAKTAAKLAFLHSSVPQTLRDQMASNKVNNFWSFMNSV